MATDWKNIDVKAIANEAGKKTDDQLAEKISALTTIKSEELKKLFPDQGDVAKFAELMQIVKSAETRNKKVAQIVANTEKFAGIIVTLLGKIV